MKKVPKINSNFLSPLSDAVGESSRIITTKCKRISPHVEAQIVFKIANVAKKADYAPDVSIFKNKYRIPMKGIANFFNMSSSHAYKISKK